MRTDEDYLSDDEEASWAELRRAGYEFTIADFQAAQDELKKEHGISTE